VAAVYRNADNNFAIPIGFDLVRCEVAKRYVVFFAWSYIILGATYVLCHLKYKTIKSGMEELCRGLQCPLNYLAPTCSRRLCGNRLCGCGCF
jgi:hypothetical protein